ncbi:MAG: hypothetical protein ABIK12_03375 [Pseudomonadota bacterium]
MIRMPLNEPLRGPVGRAVAESAVWSTVHDALGEPAREMLATAAGEAIVTEAQAALIEEG